MHMITVTIINKNSERTLAEVLKALSSFKEILFYDTGSTDSSLSIAANHPYVKIIHAPLEGFGAMHNKAAALASNDWILSLDSDELISPDLAEEIHQLKLDPDTVYEMIFHNYFAGKWIRCCGWYPDSHIRLYNRTKTSFTNSKVHEGVISEGKKVVRLNHPILHYSYGSISDFLIKMERYSTLFAQENRGKKRASLFSALYHSWAAFIKSYILKGGFKGGLPGYLISRYNAETAFYKYLKLRELNNAHFFNVSSCGKRQTCQCKKYPG